ncbi:MAG: substrate-binding domain-containing protein [Planctomycetia bacterium]
MDDRHSPVVPQAAPPATMRGRSRSIRLLGGPQLGLVALLLAEIAVFSCAGTNFATRDNAFEIARLSVEIGLLALAMTPVIITGGIDLSVGSLMGLSAVLFGKLWRDGGCPIGLAIPAVLLIGAAAGALNGGLITRLRIPPLIVTLGSFSLFRGLAEGITGGVDNFTRFPETFLFLGQGYLWGVLPPQLPIFVAVAVFFWLLVHRTTVGRALVAIGFSADGARHAGIPVDRRIGLVYLLSGCVASLAAVIYVAHLGQAKADAGTGYELLAITAVVLGGTSIFGGRGSILGTLLGLFTIAILQNGLRLSDLPAELAGILTGALLLAALGLDRLRSHGGLRATLAASSTPFAPSDSEELDVKNSQVAVLAGVILLAAALIAASNWLLARTLVREIGARTAAAPATAPIADGGDATVARAAAGKPAAPSASRPGRRVTVAMMPTSKGNAYFVACRKGAEEAAKELGVDLIWDGPTDPDPAKQNEVIDNWITRGVDVIAVAAENRVGISTVLRKAQRRGIKVLTWDADAEPDSRTFFVNQATPRGIGEALMDNAARILGGTGEFAIITASLTAGNMIDWQKEIEKRRAEKYPGVKMAALRPCDDLQKKAFDETTAILNAHPGVRVIMGICSPAPPGAAEAVKQSGRSDVKVLGLGLPNMNKRFVHEGITDCIILWKTADLGYLTVLAADALMKGGLAPGATAIEAGRLGTIGIEGDNILLGTPFTFTKDNIDQFDF